MKGYLVALVPALIAAVALIIILDVSDWQVVLIGMLFGFCANLAGVFLFGSLDEQ